MEIQPEWFEMIIKEKLEFKYVSRKLSLKSVMHSCQAKPVRN